MLVMFSTISDEILQDVDVEKTAKQTWELLKNKNGGVPRLCKAKFQSIKRNFKSLFMEGNEIISEYFGKLSRIVIDMGEKISKSEVVAKLLRSVSRRFDAITSSIEQFQDIDSLTLDEVLRSLEIHEDKVNNISVKREEKALLAQALGKAKKKDDDPA